MASRLNWVDYAKGLVIWLVVYGHTLNSAANAGVEISETFRALCESTFCNVIPLFFFVSGLFVERSYDKRGAGPFVAERLLRLAYPYFIWSTIQMVAEITFAGHSARGTTIDALFAILYRPHAQFWFLYAMVWMFVAYALIRRAGLRWRVVLAATAVLLFVFPLPTNTMALDQFSRHFLFFAAGILASRYFVGQERLPNIPLWATALLTCVSVGSSLFIFTRLIEPALLVAGPHRYYYLYLGILCGASVIGWAQWLAATARVPAIAVMGEHSMQIYVTHMLMAVAFRVVAHDLLGIDNPLVIVAGGIATAIIGAILLYKGIERFGLPNPFDPPLSKIMPVRKPA